MAALTAATSTRENVGSSTLHIFTFSAITGADTFDSGLGTSVVNYWVASRFQGGTTTTGNGASVLNASGVFTFCVGKAAGAYDLFVLARS